MGIGITLAPLLKLKIDHGYYGSDTPGIKLIATHSTLKTLAKTRCRLRTMPDGIELYASAPSGGTPKRLEGIGMILSFWLETTDPDFWTVTQPDWTGDAVNNCFFLSEKTEQAQQIASASANMLPTRPKSFHETFSAAISGETLSLIDWRGGAPVWTSAVKVQGQKTLDLSLAAVPDGRYSLHLDGTQLREFYLTDRAVSGYWGVIEIDLGSAEPTQHGQDPLTYGIVFKPRKSRWRYVIRSLKKDRDLGQARIIATPKAINFNDAIPDPSGRPDIWIIESETVLPLYASPAAHHTMTLHLPAAAGPPPLPLPLPYPTVDSTRVQVTGSDTEMWSTIYLTV